MRHESDRGGNESNGFLMGFLTGATIGAGLAILLAPKSGTEMRSQIGRQADDLKNTASNGYRRASEAAAEFADRSRDMYGQAREAVSRGIEEVREAAEDVGTSVYSGARGPRA